MARSLVIVESPAKAKTIQKILRKGCKGRAGEPVSPRLEEAG